MSPPSVSRVSNNVWAPTSHNPTGLHGLSERYLHLSYFCHSSQNRIKLNPRSAYTVSVADTVAFSGQLRVLRVSLAVAIQQKLRTLQPYNKTDSSGCSGLLAVCHSNQSSIRFGFVILWRYKTKTKLHGLSPRANYTDRATAACRRSDCQLARIEGATWSAWWIPPAAFLGFLGRSRYFSIK
jgi:hypothetical protein